MVDPANRREFLKRASVGVVAATTLTGLRASAAQRANNKLVVALVGCGGRGKHDAGLFQNTPDCEVAYACDVDETRLESAVKSLGISPNRAVRDMRKILDAPDVDIVLVTTPDHWHSPASILACNAGKHVYVEKPVSHNVREGRLLVEAAKNNKTLVQHGTQSRSTPMMIEAIKKLREGIIGTIFVAKCWNIQRRSPLQPGHDADPPKELDYDNWVGPATMIPYRTNRVHDRWTWWYHFGAGDMGNDGVHDVDYCRWGLGVETQPNKISAMGGRYYFDDEAEFPDTQQVTFEYLGNGQPSDRRILIYEQRLWSRNCPQNCDSGAEFYGDKGQMFLSRRGKIKIRDENDKDVPVDIKPEGQNDAAHVANLCAAIRDGAKLNADPLTAHLSASLCHLGNIATRLGRSLEFDPQSEQILGDDEANALVRREYRDHWGTPQGA